jgi:membrane associated rhomboid family serine protease
MFLPLKTEAHDGRIRFGAIGLIVCCILVHILVWRDNAARSGTMDGLEQELTRHKSDKKLEDMLKNVGGDGVFDDGTPAKERDSSATPAKEELLKEELQKERRASLFYRLALVVGDFNPINLITHQFTHADLMHLFFNMWFFYLVGVTLEKYWGVGKFILLYLACGVIAALGFMLVSGAASRGIPMVGASGAIAGMMGAFAVTHGDAKVTMLWIFGFRVRTFQISSRIYLGFWMAGQLWDAFIHSGQSGGVAFMAHISGFLGSILIGKTIKGDVFYKRAYVQDTFAADMDKLVSGRKLDLSSQATAPMAPAHQNGTDVITILNQASHALDDGRRRDAGNLLSSALEKAFGIPGLDPKVLETALNRVLDSHPAAELPVGALYAWARRLESVDWWQWAIRFYDAAAADPTPGTNGHAKSNARFRAAAIRMDHLYEKDRARLGFQAILASEPEGNFAEEAGARLKALQSAPDIR